MSLYHQLKTLYSEKASNINDEEYYKSCFTLLSPCIVRNYFLLLPNHVLAFSAYTLTVLRGTDFIVSLEKAYNLIGRKPLEFIVLLFVS